MPEKEGAAGGTTDPEPEPEPEPKTKGRPRAEEKEGVAEWGQAGAGL